MKFCGKVKVLIAIETRIMQPKTGEVAYIISERKGIAPPMAFNVSGAK